MDEICCRDCNRHLGWMNYAGPCGSIYCDDCKEQQDREDESARKESHATT